MAMSGRLVAWLSLVGVVAAVGYAGRITGEKTPRDALYHYSTAASQLITFAVILGVALWIAHGLSNRDAFALRRPRSWLRAARLAFVALIVILLAAYAFSPLHGAKEQGLEPSHWEPAHAAAFALNVVAFAVAGPIVEELVFRGLGFRLLERYGQKAAIVLVGVCFGLWHGLIEALPTLIVFGIALAYVRSRTGSVYPGMALHVLFNGIGLAIAVTT
jgi:membrane protease YdiL (CAAX protease family)